MSNKEFRSGFITIIGAPNAGKSTLINRIVGQKISIVSARAQTTRNKIMGVYNGKANAFDYQMIFIDTPGVALPKNRLGEYMLSVAYEALNEVEAVLFLVDSTIGIKEKDEMILERLEKSKSPVIAAINKIDTANASDVEAIKEVLSYKPFIKQVLTISAINGDGVDELVNVLTTYMVEGPMYFPEDMVTDSPERFICAEMIREKALELLRDEVPHGIGVGIDEFKYREDKDIVDISATIYCERDSHKGIIIGRKGDMIKQIGTSARMDIEWLLGSKVNLQLYVKVKPDWRNSVSILNELGYN
ncbi:MAG TPA: GTPase Era [Clostridiales bacterium]|jgi:GTP-binding protein Era|nr:GTPase Era [Clostridiales bacterium]